jgi:hypothetical protein
MRSQPTVGTLFMVSSLSLERPAGAAAAAALRRLRRKRHFANTGLHGGGDHRLALERTVSAALPYQLARASLIQKQSPACAAGLFIGAEATRYFTEATFPNWLSNGL